MNIIRIIFLHGLIEEHFKIFADCWVSVLIDGEGCGCVLDEDLAETDFDSVIFYCAEDVGGDEVEAAFVRRKSERGLMKKHKISYV